jgi:hypothetical protein
MRRTFTGCVVVAVALVTIATEGCKRKAAPAPAQPVVHRLPPVSTVPDLSVAPLKVEKGDVRGASRRGSGQSGQIVLRPARSTDGQSPAAAAAQRRRDARLLQQQQAASQRQQQELNGEVQKDVQMQQQMQAEPRIQEVPETPVTPPLQPAQEAPRIQDNPPAPPSSPQA